MLFLLLINGYLILLALSGANAFYINENYFGFNALMAAIGLVVAIAGLTELKQVDVKSMLKVSKNASLLRILRDTSLNIWQNISPILPLIAFVGLVLVVEPTPLNALAASNSRLNASAAELQEFELNPLLDAATESYRISDWARLFATETDLDRYADAPVAVEGFLFRPAEGSSTFYADNAFVGRLSVTCCAVDASVVGLELADSADLLRDRGEGGEGRTTGDWVSITGILTVAERDGVSYPLVEVRKIRQIEPPQNQYE